MANRTGLCFAEPEKLLRMKARTINRHQAFELLEPSGIRLANELFVRLATYHGSKHAYKHKYKFRYAGEQMDAEDFADASAHAAFVSAPAPKAGSIHVRG